MLAFREHRHIVRRLMKCGGTARRDLPCPDRGSAHGVLEPVAETGMSSCFDEAAFGFVKQLDDVLSEWLVAAKESRIEK